MTSRMLIFQILFAIFILQLQCQQMYNPGSTSYRNQTWLSTLDYGLPIRQISILGTHNSLALDFCLITGGFQSTQSNSLQVQLESGIRAIDIRVKHTSNKFQVYDRSCNLGVNFDQVLITVKTFLTTYPSETVLLHLSEEQSSSGCSRTFEDTYKAYRDTYAPLIWTPTTQDPQLGEVRGMIVLLQDFNGLQIHGLLWATFTLLNNKKMGTNWDLYSKWLEIKAFIPSANAAKKSQISFWTGHGGSYPYFVVSGRSSMNGGNLITGLTTPGWKSSYPDFPRVACVWIFTTICTIIFEGMNIMAYKYIVNNNIAYTGIVYTDFYGDDLLKRIIGTNKATYAKCTTTQVTQGCTLCALNTGTCLKCNTNVGYIYDSATKTCLAKVGYYLDINYYPQLCSSAEPGCLECLSAIMCTKCDTIMKYLLYNDTCIAAPGYYLNSTDIPVACPEVGCAQCSDEVNCTVCSSVTNYILDTSTGYTCKCDDPNYFTPATTVQACICMVTYYLSPNNTCEPMPKCPDMSGGCLDCGTAPNDNVCLNCDTANHFIAESTYCVCDVGYYFDGTICDSCTVNDAACAQCAGPALCLSCVSNFTLVSGVCDCIFQYYKVDNNTCNMCSTGCLVCSAIGACTVCDTANNFTLVGGYCQCIVGMFESSGVCYVCGAMAGCMDCNNAGCTVCDPMFGFHLNGIICECDYGFFINPMKVCEKCAMQGCLNCIDQQICTQCDTTLYYLTSSGICDDICGDGIRIYVECDDGNTINGDGCSSTCKVQKDYTCTGGSITTADVCSYSGPFYLSVVKTLKDKKKNKVYIDVVIQPNINSLKGIDFSRAINPTFPFQTKSATFDPTQSKISFEFTYSTSLNALTSNELNITFDPPNSQPTYYYMKAAAFSMPEVTDNNLALKYYDDNIYNLLDIMKTLTEVTAFLYVGVFCICFIFLSKLIAIELLLVPQVAFAGLIMIEKIQSLLEPLNNFRLTNGYNSLFTDNKELPPRLSILFYKGDFLSNFNICLVVVLLPVIVGLLLLLVGKVRKSKIILKYSFKTLKQWILSVLLVFQFQFTISFGIDFLFGNTMIGKALGALLLVGLLSLLVLFFKRPLNFGEFKSYFQKQPRFLNHYIIVVIFRMLLALDLILLSSNKLCGFVAIGVAGLYTLFLIITRPYLKNVRPIINMIFVLGILAVESTYKLNFYSSDAQFMTSYLPLFIVAALLVLLLINVIFMILEIREKYKKDKINEYQKNEDSSFNLELKKELERQMQVINSIQIALSPSNLNKIKQKQRMENGDESSRIKGYSEVKELHKTLLKKSLTIQVNPIQITEKDKLIYEQI